MGSACRYRDPKAHKQAGPINETGNQSANKKTKPTQTKGLPRFQSAAGGRPTGRRADRRGRAPGIGGGVKTQLPGLSNRPP